VIHAALEHGVEPSLALNLAQTESGMRSLAERHEKNGTWSHGIFQLNDRLLRGRQRFCFSLEGNACASPADPYVGSALQYMSYLIRNRGAHNLTCIWRRGEWSAACR
jgi:hypothetical protein